MSVSSRFLLLVLASLGACSSTPRFYEWLGPPEDHDRFTYKGREIRVQRARDTSQKTPAYYYKFLDPAHPSLARAWVRFHLYHGPVLIDSPTGGTTLDLDLGHSVQGPSPGTLLYETRGGTDLRPDHGLVVTYNGLNTYDDLRATAYHHDTPPQRWPRLASIGSRKANPGGPVREWVALLGSYTFIATPGGASGRTWHLLGPDWKPLGPPREDVEAWPAQVGGPQTHFLQLPDIYVAPTRENPSLYAVLGADGTFGYPEHTVGLVPVFDRLVPRSTPENPAVLQHWLIPYATAKGVRVGWATPFLDVESGPIWQAARLVGTSKVHESFYLVVQKIPADGETGEQWQAWFSSSPPRPVPTTTWQPSVDGAVSQANAYVEAQARIAGLRAAEAARAFQQLQRNWEAADRARRERAAAEEHAAWLSRKRDHDEAFGQSWTEYNNARQAEVKRDLQNRGYQFVSPNEYTR